MLIAAKRLFVIYSDHQTIQNFYTKKYKIGLSLRSNKNPNQNK